MPSNKEKQREYDKQYRKKNRARIREVEKAYAQKLRQKVVEKLGGKCIYCGCDIPEALEVNHIHGLEGVDPRHRSTTRSGLCAIIRGEYDCKIELTCRVCNASHYLEKILKLNGKWTVSFNRTDKSLTN